MDLKSEILTIKTYNFKDKKLCINTFQRLILNPKN